MMESLDFPAHGYERMKLLTAAEKPFQWDKMTDLEKVAFIRGMDKGYYQGMHKQARDAIDRFTLAIVGFKP